MRKSAVVRFFCILLAVVVILGTSRRARAASQTLTVQEAMSISAALEGWHSVVTGLQINFGQDSNAQLSWNMSYTGSSATFSATGTLDGQPLSATLNSGSLTGTWGSQLDWSGTWSVDLGGKSFTASDSVKWGYDSGVGGYTSSDFYQSASGTGSDKWYVGSTGSLLTRAGAVDTAGWTGSIAADPNQDPSTWGQFWNSMQRAWDKLWDKLTNPDKWADKPGCNGSVTATVKGSVDASSSGCGSSSSVVLHSGSGSGSTVVPEPGTLLLFGAGGLGIIAWRWRWTRRRLGI